MVKVPVLSTAMALIRYPVSRNCPPFTKMPRRAAAVRPLTTVTGVEMTSAHGQAMTSITRAL